jgi:excisionase family DNA binding protein
MRVFPPLFFREANKMRQIESQGMNHIHALLGDFADLLADALVVRLKPEIQKLLVERRYSSVSPSPEKTIPTRANDPHGSLWTVKEIAKDSGMSEATWRDWILKRKIPVVRLGRSVRIRDVDYRRLVQKSFTPELNLKQEMNRFR